MLNPCTDRSGPWATVVVVVEVEVGGAVEVDALGDFELLPPPPPPPLPADAGEGVDAAVVDEVDAGAPEGELFEHAAKAAGEPSKRSATANFSAFCIILPSPRIEFSRSASAYPRRSVPTRLRDDVGLAGLFAVVADER